MDLRITKQALKFLEELDAKQFRQIGLTVFGLLKNPLPHDSQKLAGGDAQRRVDVGEYRVIYDINESAIEILVIGKRNDDEVYKIFDRMR